MTYEKTRQAAQKAILYSETYRPQSAEPFNDDELAAWFDNLADDDKDYVMFFAVLFSGEAFDMGVLSS